MRVFFKSNRFISVVAIFALVGLLSGLLLFAGDDLFVSLQPDQTSNSVDDSTAFDGSFFEFQQEQTLGDCDTGFQGNLFDVDFSKHETRNVNRQVMEAAFGSAFDWWDPKNDAAMEIVDGYLRLTYTPTSRGSNHFSFYVGLNGGAGADEVWWEQQVYPESDWDWGGSNEGGKLNGVQGGTSDAPWNGPPSGGYPPFDGEGFSLRNMWREGRNGGQEGRLIGYTYHIDQAGKYGDSLGYSDNVFIPKEKWSTITHHVKMNSNPNQQKGAGDGVWEMWIDDQKVVEVNNLRLAANGNNHNIEQWILSTFYGGNDTSWSPSNTTHMRFRCFKASDSNPYGATATSVNSQLAQSDGSTPLKNPGILKATD